MLGTTGLVARPAPQEVAIRRRASPTRISRMRILLVGAGGVGSALARIAARRPFAELVIADYDLARAQHAAAARDGYEAVQLDARDERAVADLLTQRRCDV